MKLKSITGPELKAIRREAGINQTEMGVLTGSSRYAVSYWETTLHPFMSRQYRYGVPAKMLKILGIEILPINQQSIRARVIGVLPRPSCIKEQLDRDVDNRLVQRQPQTARHRQPCAARRAQAARVA